MMSNEEIREFGIRNSSQGMSKVYARYREGICKLYVGYMLGICRLYVVCM